MRKKVMTLTTVLFLVFSSAFVSASEHVRGYTSSNTSGGTNGYVNIGHKVYKTDLTYTGGSNAFAYYINGKITTASSLKTNIELSGYFYRTNSSETFYVNDNENSVSYRGNVVGSNIYVSYATICHSSSVAFGESETQLNGAF